MEPLETERLVLRPLAETDRAWLVALYVEAGGDEHEAEREVDEALAHERAHRFGHLVVETKDRGDRVAIVELHHAGEGVVGIEPHEVEIGWVVAPTHRGAGIATEAAHAAAAHVLSTHADHLVAYVRPANVASLRVAEKLGMRRRGPGRSRSGAPVDVLELCAGPAHGRTH